MGEQEPEGVEDVQKGEDNKGEKEPNDTAVLSKAPCPSSAEKKKTTEVQKLPLTSTSHAYGIYDAS